MPSFCIEAQCPQLAHKGTRCTGHQRIWERDRARRLPQRRAYQDKAYKAARAALKGKPCYRCGEPSDTVDHVVPLALGGANDPSNWAPACGACNFSKGGR